MTLYSFFIIIDTDDPSSFWVEMTKMNYRLRFSALKSSHIRKYGNNVHLGIHTKMSEPRHATHKEDKGDRTNGGQTRDDEIDR